MDQDSSPIIPELTGKSLFHIPTLEPLEEDSFIPTDNDDLFDQGEPAEVLSGAFETQGFIDNTQLYLREIGYSPLLTAEEEVYFSRRTRRC